jgi:Protein of unknown function (DUF3572)
MRVPGGLDAVASPFALGHDRHGSGDLLRKGKFNQMMQRSSLTRERAEGLAIQALTFIAGDGERLGRFLAATGIGPTEIRTAAREPGFLMGVLEYVSSDDGLISAFAGDNGLDPADIEKARVALAGRPWEREVP